MLARLQDRRRLSDRLACRPARQPTEGRVDPLDLPGLVGNDHPVRGRLERGPLKPVLDDLALQGLVRRGQLGCPPCDEPLDPVGARRGKEVRHQRGRDEEAAAEDPQAPSALLGREISGSRVEEELPLAPSHWHDGAEVQPRADRGLVFDQLPGLARGVRSVAVEDALALVRAPVENEHVDPLPVRAGQGRIDKVPDAEHSLRKPEEIGLARLERAQVETLAIDGHDGQEPEFLAVGHEGGDSAARGEHASITRPRHAVS